jgi:hypothetical protein
MRASGAAFATSVSNGWELGPMAGRMETQIGGAGGTSMIWRVSTPTATNNNK